MNNQLKNLIKIFCYSVFIFVLSCHRSNEAIDINIINKQLVYPDCFEGKWQGYMNILKPNEINKDSIKVEMEINKTSNANKWQWKTIYFTKDTIIKDYYLVKDSIFENKYYTNEANSIVLDNTLIEGTLYSAYSVSNSYFYTTTEIINGKIRFRISVHPFKMADTTGRINDIPEVVSYPLSVVQESWLKKIN